MAAWRVELAPAAVRQLRRASPAEIAALRGVILALADVQRPPGARKLSGRHGLWRVRIRIDGRSWRIVYQLRTSDELVVIARVAPRDEGTYRGI